jgi:hypothetical protein
LIFDLDEMLADLAETLGSALKALDEGEAVSVRRVRVEGPLTITTNISAKVGLLEGLGLPRAPERLPQREPLIDVIDDRRGLRATVLFPGIRKEDVKVYRVGKSLRFEVSKDGVVHSQDVPCGAPPRSIEVKSMSLNNSVVEIWFSKKKGVST